jgi:hypothetical protein
MKTLAQIATGRNFFLTKQRFRQFLEIDLHCDGGGGGMLATSVAGLSTSAGFLATSATALQTTTGELQTSMGMLKTTVTDAAMLQTSADELATSMGTLRTSAHDLPGDRPLAGASMGDPQFDEVTGAPLNEAARHIRAQQEQAAGPVRLTPGTFVYVTGLTSAEGSLMNGLKGAVASYLEGKERYKVDVWDSSSKKAMNIKSGNIVTLVDVRHGQLHMRQGRQAFRPYAFVATSEYLNWFEAPDYQFATRVGSLNLREARAVALNPASTQALTLTDGAGALWEFQCGSSAEAQEWVASLLLIRDGHFEQPQPHLAQ